MKLEIFKNKYLIIVIILLVVIFGSSLVFSKLEKANREGEIVTESESEWQTYINKDYHFSISFPKSWKVYENLREGTPVVNIYKPRLGKKPPFDYFSETGQVSIFPEGVTTGDILGRSTSSAVKIDFETNVAKDYLTMEGKPWATFITFKEVPDGWKNIGFVWIEADVLDLEYSCSRNNQKISINECNPYNGDIVERTGQVDDKIRDEEIEIIKTFKFIE